MIVIDSDNYTASGIETLFFPGGEPHAKIPIFGERVLAHFKLRKWNDVGLAAVVFDALVRQDASVHTFVPYFPGARQDRTDGQAPLTLAVMTRLFSNGRISVFDPHSPVLQSLLLVQALMPESLVIKKYDDVAGIIAPDKGAVDRATRFRNRFYPAAQLIECGKSRDPSSGRLSGFHMQPLQEDGRYIIVDDICDGGGTFNLLAEAFVRDPRASRCELAMFVSHGIFSRGLDAIDSKIVHITTTDSWCQLPSSSRLDVIPLLPQLMEHFHA